MQGHCGAWRPALSEHGSASVVVFSSNSTTIVPGVPTRTVKAFLAGDAGRAIRATRLFGKNAAAMVYAGSKVAVTRWMRRTAVLPEWVGAGIRMNAIAPGAVLTPLVQAQLDDPAQRAAIETFPVPAGHLGDAQQLADWVVFMLGPAAEFMVGSVVFVDGGSDAYYRADDVPRPLPLTAVGRYLRLTRQFAARRA